MRILYYIHHHGFGHITRFRKLKPELEKFSTVEIVSQDKSIAKMYPRNRFYQLRAKEKSINRRTFDSAFEGIPLSKDSINRVLSFVSILEESKPDIFISDVSAELTILARSCGIKTMMMRHSGNIETDITQVFAYECADKLFAAYPEDLELDNYPYHGKTEYLGFLNNEKLFSFDNRIDGYTIIHPDRKVISQIVSVLPQDVVIDVYGCDSTPVRGTNWFGRVPNVVDRIITDKVIASCGNNLVSELIQARYKCAFVPEDRPYDEQFAKAKALNNINVATYIPYLTNSEIAVALEKLDAVSLDSIKPEWFDTWKLKLKTMMEKL